MKVFVAMFLGAIGALCLIWTFVTLTRGEYLTSLVALGFAACFLSLAIKAVWLMWGTVSAQTAFDEAGTTIQPDRRIDLLNKAFIFGATLTMGLFAIFEPLGKLDIPVPRELRFSLPFISGFGALAGVYAVWTTFRRGAMSYLRLTRLGFELTQGPSIGQGAWSEVIDITDRRPDGRNRDRSAVVMVRPNDQISVLPGTDAYTQGGVALLQLARFYWKHPDHRDELTDGRAVERLRREAFED